jgi:tetratricopeptide (TPR) repeat protein
MGSSGNRSLGGPLGSEPVAKLVAILALSGPRPFPVEVLIEHGEAISPELRDLLQEPDALAEEAAGRLLQSPEGLTLAPETGRMVLDGLDDTERAAARQTALEILDAAFPVRVEDPRTWLAAERLLPHVIEVVAGAAPEEERVAAGLLGRAASFEFARGNFEKALELGLGAVHASPLDAVEVTGDAHQTLCRIFIELDREEEAQKQAEEALRLHLAAPEVDEESLSDDRILLAEALLVLDQVDAARDELERVMPAEHEKLRNLVDCRVLAASAWLRGKEGDRQRGLDEYSRALEEVERLEGPEHFETISMRIGKGVLLVEDGRIEEGRQELERALDLSERLLGAKHPTTDVIHSELGSALLARADLDAAREHLEVALHNGEGRLAQGHRGIWIRHRKLAAVLEKMDELDSALVHLEQAVSLSSSKDPPDRGRLGNDLRAQADLLIKMDRYSDAYGAYEAARDAYASESGSKVSSVAICEAGLARTSQAQGHLTIARKHFEIALATFADIEDDENAPGWVQGLTVELATVSARMAEELAASCKTLGQPVLARGLLDRGREAFIEILSGVIPTATLAGAITVADAARQSVPVIAFEALVRAESQLPEQDGEDERRRVGEAWHRLGRSCRFQDESERALEAFQAALPLLGGDGQLQGVALHDLADIEVRQGHFAKAIELYREAAERKREGDDNPEDLATTLVALGRALAGNREAEEAQQAYAEGRKILSSLPKRDFRMEALLLQDLGELNLSLDEREKAIELFREGLEPAREAEDPVLLANILIALGRALSKSGRHEEAVEAFEERLQVLSREPDPDLQAKGVTLHDIANVRRAIGDLEAAAALFTEAANLKRQANENPGDLAQTLLSLARVLAASGRVEEAASALEESLELLRSLPEPDRRGEAIALHETGSIRRNLGKFEEALTAYREAEAIERETGSQFELSVTLQSKGRTLKDLGDKEGALAAFEERLSLVDNPHSIGVTLHDIADIRLAQGDVAKATDLYRRAAEEKRKVVGMEQDLAVTLHGLGRALRAGGDLSAALEAFDEGAAILSGLPRPDLSAELATLQETAEVLRRLARGDEARERYQEVIARARKAAIPDVDLVPLLLGEAAVQLAQRQAEEAGRLGQEVIELLHSENDPRPDQLSAALMVAGEARLLLDDDLGAIPFLREAIEILDQSPPVDLINLAILRQRLSEAYRRQGKEEERETQLGEARAALQKALEQRIGNVSLLPVAGVLAVDLGAPGLAKTVIEQARDLSTSPEERQNAPVLVDVMRAVGRAYAEAGDFDSALATHDERLQVLNDLPQANRRALGDVYRDIGDARHAEGKLLEAIASFREAADRFLKAEEGFAAGNALRLLAAAEADRGEWDNALAALDERSSILETLPADEMRSRFEAVTLQARGNVYLRQKQAETAVALAGEAIDLLEQAKLDDPKLLAELALLGAEGSHSGGDEEGAKAFIAQAEEALQGRAEVEDLLAKVRNFPPR